MLEKLAGAMAVWARASRQSTELPAKATSASSVRSVAGSRDGDIGDPLAAQDAVWAQGRSFADRGTGSGECRRP